MRDHSWTTLVNGFTGIILSGSHAGVSRQRFPMVESADVSDLGHDLRAETWTYAIHGTDGLTLRERGCEFIHFPAELFDIL